MVAETIILEEFIGGEINRNFNRNRRRNEFNKTYGECDKEEG